MQRQAARGRRNSGRRVTAAGSWLDPDELTHAPASATARLPPRSTDLVPLSADRSRLHVTISSRLARMLEQAKDLRPDATVEEILEAGVALFLSQARKRKGLVERPQKKLRPSKPDHIPAQVRREVWKRDEGRCRWKLASGEICGSRRHLQLDHVVPLARGGTSTADNVRILCRAHNLEAARRVFGDGWMSRYTERERGCSP